MTRHRLTQSSYHYSGFPLQGTTSVRALNHGYGTPKQALETYSAAELRGIRINNSSPDL